MIVSLRQAAFNGSCEIGLITSCNERRNLRPFPASLRVAAGDKLIRNATRLFDAWDFTSSHQIALIEFVISKFLCLGCYCLQFILYALRILVNRFFYFCNLFCRSRKEKPPTCQCYAHAHRWLERGGTL